MTFARLGLGYRLLLVPVPAIAGFAAWPAFNGWFLFDTDWYVYLWYPPLMDILFGLLVLGPFAIPPVTPLRVAGLVATSVILHGLAVSATFHSQWLLPESIVTDRGPRFLTVVPIAIAASLLLFWATRLIAGCRVVPGYWRNGALAGLVAGLGFLVTMEVDSAATSWLYEHGIPWMSWHAAICLGLYTGTARPGSGVEWRAWK